MKALRTFLPSLIAMSVLVVPAEPAFAWGVDVKGRVIHVADGDTIDVDIWGDGTSTPVRIRIIGVQATEIHVPQTTSDDDCHAKQAQDWMKATLRPKDLYGTGEVVRLFALHASSSNRGRPLRHVIRVRDGLNVGRALLTAQFAFAFPLSYEPSYNKTYMAIAQKARAYLHGGRIWDNDWCGAGPYQSAPIKMWANYKREGTATGEAGEWIKIQNLWTSSITLSGWTVRDAGLHYYKIPTRTIAPKGILTIYIVNSTGYTNTSTKLYWDVPGSTTLLEDPNSSGTTGDSVILTDPKIDTRASFLYPCLYACIDPLQGKIDIDVHWDPAGADWANGEWIDVHNVSDAPVTLGRDYVMEYGATTSALRFLQFTGSVIPAGETLRIYIGKGTSSTLTKYWGKSEPLLNNTRGWVRIRTWDDRWIERFDWP